MKRPPAELTEKLLAASEGFAGTGFDVSIDDVARMAGVPRATLYYYFAGKDDLVSFYVNAELDRVGDVVAKAAAGEGTVQDRLEAALASVLYSLTGHPMMCVELPKAMKQPGDFQEVMASMDRVVMTPIRELLIEGRAVGEFDIADPVTTSFALMGAVNLVAMMEVVQPGTIDVDATAATVVPQLVKGLLKD
jgi:TetR/AcrR family transcriptional regulator